MTRPLLSLLALSLVACASEAPAPSNVSATATSPLVVGQGGQMQGGQMQGGQMQGGQMQGELLGGETASVEDPLTHRYDGATLGGTTLESLRIERGGLVAERVVPLHGKSTSAGPTTRETLRGEQLLGAQLQAVTSAGVTLRHRIAQVRAEDADTFLYRLEQQSADGTWSTWCGADASGGAEAIPVAAVFDRKGDRHESTTRFTFGCTSGAIAKCYRWGYKPWLAHPQGATVMRELHWACTRLARADYCGDGTPHTRDGTQINVWDTLSDPGPIQSHGEPLPGMLFEAGWSPRGAVCLSKQRWLTLSLDIAAACPDRLVPPGAGVGTATVCESPAEAQTFDTGVQLFNESQLNL
jgi:hypothetical protein